MHGINFNKITEDELNALYKTLNKLVQRQDTNHIKDFGVWNFLGVIETFMERKDV